MTDHGQEADIWLILTPALLLMLYRFEIPVWCGGSPIARLMNVFELNDHASSPHAGGVGLCELVIHLSLIDYIAVSGTMERNVLE